MDDDPFAIFDRPVGKPRHKPTWPHMKTRGGVQSTGRMNGNRTMPVAHEASRRMARGGKVELEMTHRPGRKAGTFLDHKNLVIGEIRTPNWDRLRDPIIIEKNHSRMLFLYRPDASGTMWMFRDVTPTGEKVSIGYFSEGKARWAYETGKIIWQQL